MGRGVQQKTHKYIKKKYKQQHLYGLGGSRSWRRVRNMRRPRVASQQQGELEPIGAAGG